MKVTQLLQVAEEAITGRDVSHDGSFDLCVREGIILCIPTMHLKPTDKFVISLTKSDIHNGLNNEQWGRIFRTLHIELINGRIK